MSAVMLDSSVVIDLLKRRSGAVGRLRELQETGDSVFVCAVVAEEVTYGLRAPEREAASMLFEGFEVAPLGVSEGMLAGWWRRRYRSRGRTIGQPDCLIAASALALGARIATGNPKDFPMKEITVEHWPVGQ